MGDLPKLAWSRDVTGKVNSTHSNLTQHDITVAMKEEVCAAKKAAQKMPC